LTARIHTHTRTHTQWHNKNSSGDEIANVNFYAVHPRSYRNSLKSRKITAITPFKVRDYGTNRKLIYDFLLVL